MTKKTEVYRVISYENPSLINLTTQLNFIFGQISNRIDRLEGIRNNPSFEGTLQAGIIPLDRLRRAADVTAETSAGTTTVTTDTTIIQADLGTVRLSDVVLVHGMIQATKGGTGGSSTYTILKNGGTATIRFCKDRGSIGHSQQVAANETTEFHFSGFGIITVAGTLQLQMSGTSDGSNSTITDDKAQMRAIILVGA